LRENYYIENYECVNKKLAIRTDEIHREYQRKWAEENRRKKGVPIKENRDDEYWREYKAKWTANKRASLTDEEKKEQLKHRRELYAKKEQTEDQKEAAKERAKKQREAIKADPEKLAQQKEYKRLKAKEYREKKQTNNV
jgi:hypothetical protein